jgi:hypothetical protein
MGRHDTQHNDIQPNDVQHNDTGHKGIICDIQHNDTVHNAILQNNSLSLCWIVIMLSVGMLNVVILSVVVPIIDYLLDSHLKRLWIYS